MKDPQTLNKSNWKNFERLVAAIHNAETQGAIVTWNEKINGRQFDVTLRFKFGLHDYLTVIECKEYKDKIPIEKVEAFITKASDVNASKSVMVSSSGFQSGCLDVAARHGIKLLTLNKKIDINIDELAAEFVPVLNINDVKLILQDGSDFLLEDEGGRLTYLMNNIILDLFGQEITLHKYLNSWQVNIDQLSPEVKYNKTLMFPKGTLAKIPLEGTSRVTAIKFQYKLTKGFIPKGSNLDSHVLESLNTSYELLDESGEIVHKAEISKLELGFDTNLTEGKFYFTPSIHNYYYCEKIENDLAHFILVETYQHGILFQCRMTLSTQYSSRYLEVTDKKKLYRLENMLKKFLDKTG